MKISYDPIEDPTAYFSDLANGTIFRYESEGYFMKIRTRGDSGLVYAICLQDYSLLYFDGEDQVIPVEAILTIKGEEL